MGGGDLNSKKSWHPNTIRNQEKVWKAEKTQAEENRRMEDLRKEMDNERFREELCDKGQSSGVLAEKPNKKLDWMYKEPGQEVDREQYLLGKAIDKTIEKLIDKDQTSSLIKSSKNHVEHECIPFSIRNFRNGTDTSDAQVDIARKLMEDPLVAIRKREIESRAQLLQNPIKLKQLTMKLKADQEKQRLKKEKKKSKKSKKSKDKLESKLLEKLKKLESDKLTDIKKILSGDSSSHSKKKKKRSKSTDSSSDSSDDDKMKKRRRDRSEEKLDRRRETSRDRRTERIEPGRDRNYRRDDRYASKSSDSDRNRSNPRKWEQPGRNKLSEEEKERKRREMMENAVVRDRERETTVSKYRERQRLEDRKAKERSDKPDFISKELRKAADCGTIESRINSNRNNIQRSYKAMDSNFARR